MSDKSYKCITYFRLRAGERRANMLASDQQRSIEEEAIEREGYSLVARFGDPEFAEPFGGWLEPRPAWDMAVEEARHVFRKHGNCTILILRSDGIGDGDLFLPKWSSPDDWPDIEVRVAGFGLRRRAVTSSLRDANLRFERYCEMERSRDNGTTIPLRPSLSGDEILIRRDYRKYCARLYYANWSSEPLALQWQATERPLLKDDRWSECNTWNDMIVPPNSGLWLQTFFQGERDPVACHWRFRVGSDRQRKIGNTIVTPMLLTRSSLGLRWSPYEPERPRSYDYAWEDRPSIETGRLRLRNWEEDDDHRFAQHCNTSEVMRFLGGVQSPLELDHDLELFVQTGKAGPTYWALERKADGDLLGFCGLIEVQEAGSPVEGEWEIGWRLRADTWGQGCAYEAAAAVLEAAFDEWEMEKVVCRIDARNHASIRVAEKLGMVENVDLKHETEEEEQTLLVFEMDGMQHWRTGMTSAALD